MTGERPAGDRVGRVLSGLGPRIRRARRERGMTLERLAAAAGTSAAHLSRLESGERQPSLDGALRLAMGLGVPFSELFEEPEEPGPGTVVRGEEAPIYEGPGFRLQPLVPEAGPGGDRGRKGDLPCGPGDGQRAARARGPGVAVHAQGAAQAHARRREDRARARGRGLLRRAAAPQLRRALRGGRRGVDGLVRAVYPIEGNPPDAPTRSGRLIAGSGTWARVGGAKREA